MKSVGKFSSKKASLPGGVYVSGLVDKNRESLTNTIRKNDKDRCRESMKASMKESQKDFFEKECIKEFEKNGSVGKFEKFEKKSHKRQKSNQTKRNIHQNRKSEPNNRVPGGAFTSKVGS